MTFLWASFLALGQNVGGGGSLEQGNEANDNTVTIVLKRRNKFGSLRSRVSTGIQKSGQAFQKSTTNKSIRQLRWKRKQTHMTTSVASILKFSSRLQILYCFDPQRFCLTLRNNYWEYSEQNTNHATSLQKYSESKTMTHSIWQFFWSNCSSLFWPINLTIFFVKMFKFVFTHSIWQFFSSNCSSLFWPFNLTVFFFKSSSLVNVRLLETHE